MCEEKNSKNVAHEDFKIALQYENFHFLNKIDYEYEYQIDLALERIEENVKFRNKEYCSFPEALIKIASMDNSPLSIRAFAWHGLLFGDYGIKKDPSRLLELAVSGNKWAYEEIEYLLKNQTNPDN